MTTAWSHLPNAKHIDRVLASLKANLEKWDAALDTAWNAAWSVARGMAWDATQEAARNVARDTAWRVAWDVIRDTAWRVAWESPWDAAERAARGAIVALIAYDDCAYMLDSDVGELKIIAALGDPRAILLLPACIIFNEMKIA